MSSVLLVDDEPGVLFTLAELLSERGHKTITARSGSEALAKLEDADAVLTDLSMPGMDGLELMSQIAQRDPGLPVILLTAHGSERVAVAAMKQGAYDYLSKPFDIDEIAVVIERALEARRLRIDNRRLSAEQTLGRRIIGTSRPMRRLLEATSRVASRRSRSSASTAPPCPPSSRMPSCSATCAARSPARPRIAPASSRPPTAAR
jgi:two-component system response regulator AtoC